MKIKVDADGHRFTIIFPISLITNGLTIGIIEKSIKKHANVTVTKEQLVALSKTLKEAKKTFPKLALVDIKTGDGESVLITL